MQLLQLQPNAKQLLPNPKPPSQTASPLRLLAQLPKLTEKQLSQLAKKLKLIVKTLKLSAEPPRSLAPLLKPL